MRPSMITLVVCLLALPVAAQTVARSETLQIAETYIGHRWIPSDRNLFHGRDANGIEVHTPDAGGGRGAPPEDCWRVDVENIGVAYKWGGNDTPETFDAGLKAGKAAGDVFTPEKRRLDDNAVSSAAVGIDCSGFICRCWKTKKRYSTISLGEICRKLPSVSALQPADIMNQPHGHVLLFVKWFGDRREVALFYESAPYSKTRATWRNVNQLTAAGFIPMRYRHIRG